MEIDEASAKTILPPEGKDAATGKISSAPNSGTETSQAGGAEISSYGAADLGHFVETAADPDAIAKTDGWSGYAAVPADRHNVHVVGKTAAHLVLPWIHHPTSKDGREATGCVAHLQAYLDEFVFRFRHAAFRSRHQCRTPYLQHVDRTGAMCISGSGNTVEARIVRSARVDARRGRASGRDPKGGAVRPTGFVKMLARCPTSRYAAFLPWRPDSAAQAMTLARIPG